MLSGKAGRETNPSPGQTNMHFLTIWRHLVDLGSRFGAHWILKGSPNRRFSYKINIKFEKQNVQEGVLKQNDFWMDF